MAKRKSFLLRMDPKLWDEINAWADKELRSVNGQIEFLLREAVNRRRKHAKEEPASPHEDE
ncbi:MAG: PTS ascorbate transporter subunit IIC [Candidatus Hinthialibacter antarcticus]|nr:PTS ascorbate transporter subunit IIC [Candidatus Hinthialibacter antarcticus]